MSDIKNRYKAKLAGKTYTVIGGETKAHMDIVTEIANRQLAEIQEISPETSLENAAILLGINAISDQLKKERKIMTLESELAALKKELAEQPVKVEESVEVKAEEETTDTVAETQAETTSQEN